MQTLQPAVSDHLAAGVGAARAGGPAPSVQRARGFQHEVLAELVRRSQE